MNVLNPDNFKHYVDRFNSDDIEDVVNLISENHRHQSRVHHSKFLQGRPVHFGNQILVGGDVDEFVGISLCTVGQSTLEVDLEVLTQLVARGEHTVLRFQSFTPGEPYYGWSQSGQNQRGGRASKRFTVAGQRGERGRDK